MTTIMKMMMTMMTMTTIITVCRLFVNMDITVITAKDGNDLAPLNIALRKKVKNCASFLLTKQWSKVSVQNCNTSKLTHIEDPL
jgi:hypothetical protein